MYVLNYIYNYIYICILGVDLKVHVGIVNYKGRQCYNKDPAKVFSEFAKVNVIWQKNWRKFILMSLLKRLNLSLF